MPSPNTCSNSHRLLRSTSWASLNQDSARAWWSRRRACRREASAPDLHSSWQGGKNKPFLRQEQQQKVGLNTNKQASQNRRTQICHTANQTILPCPGMLRTPSFNPDNIRRLLIAPWSSPSSKRLAPPSHHYLPIGTLERWASSAVRIPASRRLKQDERSRRHCQKAEPGGCRLSKRLLRAIGRTPRARSVTRCCCCPAAAWTAAGCWPLFTHNHALMIPTTHFPL